MKSLYRATIQRLGGEQPSPIRAAAAAATAGAATGILVYRLLRSG